MGFFWVTSLTCGPTCPCAALLCALSAECSKLPCCRTRPFGLHTSLQMSPSLHGGIAHDQKRWHPLQWARLAQADQRWRSSYHLQKLNSSKVGQLGSFCPSHPHEHSQYDQHDAFLANTSRSGVACWGLSTFVPIPQDTLWGAAHSNAVSMPQPPGAHPLNSDAHSEHKGWSRENLEKCQKKSKEQYIGRPKTK